MLQAANEVAWQVLLRMAAQAAACHTRAASLAAGPQYITSALVRGSDFCRLATSLYHLFNDSSLQIWRYCSATHYASASYRAVQEGDVIETLVWQAFTYAVTAYDNTYDQHDADESVITSAAGVMTNLIL